MQKNVHLQGLVCILFSYVWMEDSENKDLKKSLKFLWFGVD